MYDGVQVQEDVRMHATLRRVELIEVTDVSI